MRRTRSRRPFVAALLVASVLTPIAVTPATAVQGAAVDRVDRVDRYDRDECPPDGLGPELTARLDEAVAGVRREAGIPGVAVGL